MNLRKHNILLLLPVLALFLAGLSLAPPSGLITISGQYLDKKSNPIVNAQVAYLNSGQLAGSGITDDEGDFFFQAIIVGFKPITVAYQDNLEIPGPNPFTQETQFKADIEEEGVLRIFDIQDKQRARAEKL